MSPADKPETLLHEAKMMMRAHDPRPVVPSKRSLMEVLLPATPPQPSNARVIRRIGVDTDDDPAVTPAQLER